jgi:hypothetical protein
VYGRRESMTLKSIELINEHIIERGFPLNSEILEALENKDWKKIDQIFLDAEKPGGFLFHFMQEFLDFETIEHIIAIRSAPGDEDGIWHDDGSRILGFSLSLTQNHEEVIGGELRFRPKNQKDRKDFQSFSTRPLGRILLFKTGIYGFEHMVSEVKNGQRVVIAGWCS